MSVSDGVPLNLLPLAALPMPEWPKVAQSWLADGHYSQALADFAALSPAEGHVLADLMLDVLRSLGVGVGDAGVFGGVEIFQISGFEQRCLQAVEPVAGDLTTTWRPIRLRVSAALNEPPLRASVILGKDLSSSSDQMYAYMDDWELVASAATQVSEALLEVAGYQWPLCIAHARRIVIRECEAHPEQRNPVWRCDGRDGHDVAEVGHLSADDARCEEMWWATERRFDLDATDG